MLAISSAARSVKASSASSPSGDQGWLARTHGDDAHGVVVVGQRAGQHRPHLRLTAAARKFGQRSSVARSSTPISSLLSNASTHGILLVPDLQLFQVSESVVRGRDVAQMALGVGQHHAPRRRRRRWRAWSAPPRESRLPRSSRRTSACPAGPGPGAHRARRRSSIASSFSFLWRSFLWWVFLLLTVFLTGPLGLTRLTGLLGLDWLTGRPRLGWPTGRPRLGWQLARAVPAGLSALVAGWAPQGAAGQKRL